MKVDLVNLTKKFGPVTAVDRISLDIKDGEFVAFLGPSGCGKTTTLLMLAGIYKPSEGDIFFDGHQVNNFPPKDRDIGMVFQSYALYPHMSVFQNLSYPLLLKKRPKDEQKDLIPGFFLLSQWEETILLYARQEIRMFIFLWIQL